MTSENIKAEEIFHEAIEITDQVKRSAYLDRACGQDRDLRVEVETLLRAHEVAGDFLKSPTLDPEVTLEESPVLEGPGTRIGRYEVLELIGEGGMGLVYLAEQKEPVRRRVALKIIKPGMDSRQVVARFEAERQVLALLDHPNIARVFDAGTTETGRPYFVMEYVKGMSITKYCDRHKFSVEKRLKLFLRVCEAVHHAHQKGIIHRDIKPSNILLSVQDDRPVPKIIDFGIAKAIAQPLTQQTLFTRQGQLLGTPEYMSPEQADMDNEDTDTRADIYSLGVVLYELLTGVLPFEHKALEKVGFAELQRILQEEEPPRPSLRFTALGQEAKEIAERRHTQVVALARRLHRELEWIPLKAMRKDRSRRYRSASELADDIQNYLSGAPLIAGPETAMYRTKKFVRKHAGSVATVALVAAVIVLGLIVSTAMYFRAEKALQKEAVARTQAEKAEKVASEQRELAEEQAEKYRRSLYFNHIALADASYQEGNITRVRELLDACPEDLRRWEWYRINHISDQSEMTLSAHGVRSVASSPDGKYIASGSNDKTIKVWNAATGAELMTLRGHEEGVGPVSFSPDGSKIVSGSGDTTVRIWDATSSGELKILRGHDGPVTQVAFSPDGERIISCGGKMGNTRIFDSNVKIWDVATGAELMTLRGHDGWVWSVAYSPDGKRIASCGRDLTIKIWDAETGDELITFKAHEGRINSVVFSPDGKRLVSGSADETVKVWDAATGDELTNFRGHTDSVFDVAFSPDGRHAASSSRDRTVRLWDMATGTELLTLRGHQNMVACVAFSPDGNHIISGALDSTIKIWDVTISRQHMRLIDTETPVGFSSDGKRIVTSAVGGRIKVWDRSSGTELMTLHGHEKSISSVSFSPDGKHIISGSWDGTIKIWDAENGDELMTFSRDKGCVYAQLSPDGRRIASWAVDYGRMEGPYEKTIKLYDAATGAEIRTILDHGGYFRDVVFSPDSKRLASCDSDGTVKIWDAESGDEMMTVNHGAFCVIFSPDGAQFVSGGEHRDKTIKLWDTETGAEIIAFKAYDIGIGSLAFSPDGRRIVSGNRAGVVKVWDAATGFEMMTLSGHGSAKFSPDGKTIAISSESGITLLESEVPAGGYGPRQNGMVARELVDELYEEHGLYSEVINKLKDDNTIDKAVRKIALQIANARLWEDTEKQKEQTQDPSPKEAANSGN